MKEQKKMKKLMIAAAIVCAAAMSQAASCGWSVSGVTPDDQMFVGYCYFSNNGGDTAFTKYTSITAIEALINGTSATKWDDVAAASAKTIEIDGGEGTASRYSNSNWGASGESVVNGFAVIFNVDDLENISRATEYMVLAYDEEGNLAKARLGTATAKGDLYISGNYATWSEIQSVPEPTSGLLLLLGVAGLALRRRRA